MTPWHGHFDHIYESDFELGSVTAMFGSTNTPLDTSLDEAGATAVASYCPHCPHCIAQIPLPPSQQAPPSAGAPPQTVLQDPQSDCCSSYCSQR